MHGDYFQIYTALQWQQQKQGEQQLNKSSCEVISSIQVDLSEVYLEEIQESEKTKKQEQKQEHCKKKIQEDQINFYMLGDGAIELYTYSSGRCVDIPLKDTNHKKKYIYKKYFFVVWS